MTQLLFIHGGSEGAYDWDERIVARLQPLLGADTPIACPRIEGLEALDWSRTKAELGKLLSALPPQSIVVAHSIGAAAILKLLSEGVDPRLKHLFLLAPPYNGADGEWGDSDFAFPADFARRLPRGLPITLYHSEDDDVIEVESAHRYAEKMPAAQVVIIHDYGHQFTRALSFLANAIKKAAA